jgi:CRISPR/Cas system-associated exonuclease Cas4 (RecB family)
VVVPDPPIGAHCMSDRVLPAVLRVTPTSLEAFAWCPRRYLLRHVLHVPESDAGRSSDQGRLVHDLLRHIHTRGSCHDDALVDDVVTAHADDAAIRTMLERHRRRCPTSADDAAHEVSRARYHHMPVPYFLATARLDAVWVHDGVFDVRDYKTGGPGPTELGDDVRAQVQAWVWAPRAAARGLRLRLRYEYLSPEVDDDPEPWEPDDDDLAAVEERLRVLATTIRTSDFAGVGDAHACRPCPYRSVCRDSAAPGVPTWPVLSLAVD